MSLSHIMGARDYSLELGMQLVHTDVQGVERSVLLALALLVKPDEDSGLLQVTITPQSFSAYAGWKVRTVRLAMDRLVERNLISYTQQNKFAPYVITLF